MCGVSVCGSVSVRAEELRSVWSGEKRRFL